jgi:hypothetical protein
MSDNKLVLIPATPEAAPPPGQVLERALREIGLIGEATNHFGDTHYRPGPRFHDLIVFERSHPVVHLRHGPEGLERDGVSDSRTLCTVELSAPTPEVEWLGGADMADPSCRLCGHSLRDWGDMLGDWFNDRAGYAWSCPACRRQSRPWELDWQDTCGFGRCSVDIWQVHYGEARPHADLLEVLRATTQAPWGYFYFHR